MDILLQQNGEYYTKNDSSEFITYLLNDITSAVGFITDTMVPLSTDVIKGIVMIVFLIFLRWELLLVVVLTQPLIWFVQKKMRVKITEISEENRKVFSKYIGKTKEFCSNLINIRMISSEPYVLNCYNKILVEQKNISLKKSKIENVNMFFLGMVYIIPFCLIMLLGYWEIKKTLLTVGGLLLFIQYSGDVFLPFYKIFEMFSVFAETQPSCERIINLFSHKKYEENDNNKKDIKRIGMRNAYFSYGNNYILRNASFEFKSGCSYAIIGDSGSGKSTLCKLLLGMWELNKGYITINGERLQGVNLKDYITYISQDSFILTDTIYNNIVLGDEVDYDNFENSLKKIGLYELVNNLDKKQNTFMNDEGIAFSGGQKQRISIARALVRNKPIVIFDEPTSNLDVELRDKIIEEILKMFCENIIIIISHDYFVCEKCDKKYKLIDGKILEQ